jgi:DNA-binding response OmpR family regulator
MIGKFTRMHDKRCQAGDCTMKILVVDDDPIILELLTEVLRIAGYNNLTMCESAYEALDAIASATVPFDCFLFDIQMPGMDGVELTSAVRKMPSHTTSPILMITAMSDRHYIDNAFTAGATDYITKPFEIAEVHARLKGVAERVEQRRQLEDRNPVAVMRAAAATLTQADLEARLAFVDLDGFIEYLALENYLLLMSRVSLIGMRTFGIAVPDLERVFGASSVFEYHAALADFAEAISDALKPGGFFVAHAGGGKFVCVLTDGATFDAANFEVHLHETVAAMDFHFCDGRPMTLTPVVGEAVSLQMKSARGLAGALVLALSSAEAAAKAPRARKPEPASGNAFKFLFGF